MSASERMYRCDGTCGESKSWANMKTVDNGLNYCYICFNAMERERTKIGAEPVAEVWKGPLECPVCKGKDFWQEIPTKEYHCNSELCKWECSEEMGGIIGDRQRAGYTVEHPENITPALLGLEQSGNTNVYATGAQRDSQVGKGRFDLLPFACMQSYARRLEAGAPYYGRHNWRKGIPVDDAASSACRHIMEALEVLTRREMDTLDQYTDGLEKEDHLGAAMFNIGILLQDAYDTQHKKDYKTVWSPDPTKENRDAVPT